MISYNYDFNIELDIRKGYINKAQRRIASMKPTEDGKEIYSQLEELAGQIEKLSYHLRETLTAYHLQLQFEGLTPSYSYLDNPPDVTIGLQKNILTITLDALLPIEGKGGDYYLNGKLEDAILGYRQKEKMTSPLFTEKCGVIFYHHYAMKKVGKCHLRDFDNLEKRTITNVLTRHFMIDDNPFAMISTDILVPDTSTYTEIKLCHVDDFKRLILASEL